MPRKLNILPFFWSFPWHLVGPFHFFFCLPVVVARPVALPTDFLPFSRLTKCSPPFICIFFGSSPALFSFFFSGFGFLGAWPRVGGEGWHPVIKHPLITSFYLHIHAAHSALPALIGSLLIWPRKFPGLLAT